MTTLERLIEARALISHPSKWTQRREARDIEGEDCDPLDDDAVCYCSIGALKATGDKLDGLTMRALLQLAKTIGDDVPMWEYNDSHSYEEVIAVWDTTIERLQNANAQ